MKILTHVQERESMKSKKEDGGSKVFERLTPKRTAFKPS